MERRRGKEREKEWNKGRGCTNLNILLITASHGIVLDGKRKVNFLGKMEFDGWFRFHFSNFLGLSSSQRGPSEVDRKCSACNSWLLPWSGGRGQSCWTILPKSHGISTSEPACRPQLGLGTLFCEACENHII